MGPPVRDIPPLWVADMDFAAPPAVIEALHAGASTMASSATRTLAVFGGGGPRIPRNPLRLESPGRLAGLAARPGDGAQRGMP